MLVFAEAENRHELISPISGCQLTNTRHGEYFAEQRLVLLLREGLTRHLIGRYLANRTYFRLAGRPDIDNPDQRITEDVKSFTQMAVSFLVILLNAFLAAVSFTGVLWFIAPRLVIAAIACYSCTLAPVTWVVLSEIFPNRVRGTAMALAVFALWAACFILTYTFPLLNRSFGPAGTFWIYAAICVLGFVFIVLRLPETKGKTLEEIEAELENRSASA